MKVEPEFKKILYEAVEKVIQGMPDDIEFINIISIEGRIELSWKPINKVENEVEKD